MRCRPRARRRRRGWSLALLLTALNYLASTGYDFIAIDVHRPTSAALPHWMGHSFLAYAIANNVGFAACCPAPRCAIASTRDGASPAEESLAHRHLSNSVDVLARAAAARRPQPRLSSPPARPSRSRHECVPVGWVLHRGQHRLVRRWPWSARPISVRRIRAAAAVEARLAMRAARCCRHIDWALAGAVLYVLLPPSRGAISSTCSARSLRLRSSDSSATCPVASASSKV